MEAQKIVARYVNGKILKGHTINFAPDKPTFILKPVEGGPEQVVQIGELKAVFFVRDFLGRRSHEDRKFFVAHQPYQGRRAKVRFVDGEVIVGSLPNYCPDRQGFFVFPADDKANAIKIFAVTANIKAVEMM